MKELIDNFMNEYASVYTEDEKATIRLELEIIFMQGKIEGNKESLLLLNK